MIKFGSLCSGIEAASVAWHPLGWKCAWVSEVDEFCSALLKHHYPAVENLGDMTKIEELLESRPELADIDVLAGGTPCQAFSIAGLRGSLDDARGNLTLVFCRIVDAIDKLKQRRGHERPLVVLWENVPGVLNTNDNAFGCFLGALAGEGAAIDAVEKWPYCGLAAGPERQVAWRVIDAEGYVPQRRTRVFVCASRPAGGFDPCRVLLEGEADLERHFGGRDASEIQALIKSLRWDFKKSRKARQEVTPTLRGGAAGGSRHGKRGGSDDPGLMIPEIAGPLGGSAQSGGFRTADLDNNGAFIPEVSYALSSGQGGSKFGSGRERQDTFVTQAVSFQSRIARNDRGQPKDVVDALRSDAGKSGKGDGAPLVAVSFKPSFSTRGKDGTPSEVAAPLSADADKGDQDQVVMTPQAYRVHGEHSTAMQSNGIANVADPVDCARSLDTCGRYATNQGGNVVLSPEEVAHGHEEEANAIKALRTLRQEVGAENMAQWCTGVITALREAKILRPEVHGDELRRQAEPQHGLLHGALPRQEVGASWSMLNMRKTRCGDNSVA